MNGKWVAGLAAILALAWGAPPAQARTDLGSPEVFGRGPRSLYAVREPNIFIHNVGLLTLQVTNIGLIGNPFIQDLSAGWRKDEYLHFAGLWVGAIGEDGDPHVSTAWPVEMRPSLLAEDTIYESYEGIRGGIRPGYFTGDDDGDGRNDEEFHNGKDDDGDGRIDEDYAAIGQQMFSCEYWDNTAEAISQISEHQPLEIKVQQRSFQWALRGINEFVGFDFRIINIGDQRLRSIYIGFNVDADAGPKAAPQYWADDLAGFVSVDTTVDNPYKTGPCARENISMDIAYVWDAPDNGTTITGGDAPGYFGGLFLGHNTDPTGLTGPFRLPLTTVRWTSATGVYPDGDPDTDFERYDLLSRGTIPSRNAVKPDDYRITIAAGQFELNPGDVLSFQTAFVIGEGRDGMIRNAVNAQQVYNGHYVDRDRNPQTGIDGKERCLIVLHPPGEVLWDDPCDTLFMLESIRRSDRCRYVDDDCTLCTGVDGKEHLLNWIGTTAPPSPGLNTDPELQAGRIADPNFNLALKSPGGDKRVILQWNNISELRPDPTTGENLFEGYRIWRADNWHRPEGSIGPTPAEWTRIAEFRKSPLDGRKLQSPRHLRVVLQESRNDIEEMTPFGPQYKVGRYEWEDSIGVKNGLVYFYAVTAFGLDTVKVQAGDILVDTPVELGGSPAAGQKELVVTSWGTGNGCGDIKIVPNPYRGGADWDLMPKDCDPTGTKIAIRNLPEGWNNLSIYSLAGDRILTAGPLDSRVVGSCDVAPGNRQSGTFYWDLLSRNGQDVVSGIYMYVVETGGQLCRGHFVIVR